jgi:hypothetical protein
MKTLTDTQTLTEKAAKRLILDLIDAASNLTLADNKDGGLFGFAQSRMQGKEHEAMSLAEAEFRIDSAIQRAYHALRGKEITGDPVDFIHS